MTDPSLSLESIRLATSDITYDANGSTFRDIMLRHVDMNHDGVISLKEDGINQSEHAYAYSQLRKFDTNRDDTLTATEVVDLCLQQANALLPQILVSAYDEKQDEASDRAYRQTSALTSLGMAVLSAKE